MVKNSVQFKRRKGMKKGIKGRLVASKISLIEEIRGINIAAGEEEGIEKIRIIVPDLDRGQIGRKEIGIQNTEENTKDPEVEVIGAKTNTEKKEKDKEIDK
jgi:hypothetical protein